MVKVHIVGWTSLKSVVTLFWPSNGSVGSVYSTLTTRVRIKNLDKLTKYQLRIFINKLLKSCPLLVTRMVGSVFELCSVMEHVSAFLCSISGVDKIILCSVDRASCYNPGK
jgi:hypothetical protein